MSNSLRLRKLYCPWNSPDQNTGMGSHSLLQEIFPAQGSSSGLPYCRRDSLPAEPTSTAAAKSLQSCLTLCYPIDGSPPGSSVPRILQARRLEWVASSFSNACMHANSLQSCPTLCDPIDGSPLGSSVYRILQARKLEWIAISFSTSFTTSSQLFSLHLAETSFPCNEHFYIFNL